MWLWANDLNIFSPSFLNCKKGNNIAASKVVAKLSQDQHYARDREGTQHMVAMLWFLQ